MYDHLSVIGAITSSGQVADAGLRAGDPRPRGSAFSAPCTAPCGTDFRRIEESTFGRFWRGAGSGSCGAVAGLCTGAESEGGYLKASEAGRTEEPLLRPPGGVDVGTAPYEGTAAAQALGDQRLLQASRPPLALFVRISKNAFLNR